MIPAFFISPNKIFNPRGEVNSNLGLAGLRNVPPEFLNSGGYIRIVYAFFLKEKFTECGKRNVYSPTDENKLLL